MVIGHERALALLGDLVAGANFPHALLISGPTGIGKTTIALELASALGKAESWPGGVVSHPDIWIEDGDDERIGIDRIRRGDKPERAASLQETFAMRPYAGGHRVAVIARADRLTEDAANSLLKTLEEPPPQTHLILTSALPERLPATIVSRCRQLYLGLVDRDAIARWLSQLPEMTPEKAGLIAVLSAGRPGRAHLLAGDAARLEAELNDVKLFGSLHRVSVEAALTTAARFTGGSTREDRDRALRQLNAGTSFIRDAISVRLGHEELVVWRALGGELPSWAALGIDVLLRRLEACLHAVQDIANYAQPRLALEALFLSFTAAA